MKKNLKDTVRYAGIYDTETSLQHYGKSNFEVGLLEAEKNLVLKYFKNKFDIKIADMGCGTGRFALNLSLLGYRYIDGYDISLNSINFAKSCKENLKFKNSSTKINFIHADLTEYKFTEEKYDLIFFTFNSLMCIPFHKNKIKVLKKSFKLLKPNGILIFTADQAVGDLSKEKYINENKIRLISQQTLWRPEDIVFKISQYEGVLCYYNKEDILKMLKEANLPNPILIKTRDEIGIENKEAKKFSDNAYYYVLKNKPLK
ncbi:class I SAM-dependent methyltransferase [Mycoplasmopsis cricetuli]|uniref:class I SAM-dependent methyltransferase n=1 Tax=Mycoplasmopsis cricetuli TaxID=171283 RepID=UPI000472AE1C|nr:class I SAM-dependent methyltransferase [Mycoplasmopsis cricetuli]